MNRPELWGPLKTRDENPDRPHRLLALDGGGIRGVITLGILEKMESLLAQKSKDKDSFRLCDWFHYVAGTSTGAIIAAGIARGMRIDELIQFYRENGIAMFESSHLMQRLVSFYQADPLRKKLQDAFGAETTLEPQHLKCQALGNRLVCI